MIDRGQKAQNIAQYNNKIVSQLLIDNPYSCIEMSKKVNLTHTATGLIVDRLLNMGLIRVCVEKNSKRTKGRQHVRYELNPNRAFFVCVSFQNSFESLTVCNISGNVLYCEKLNGETVDNVYLDKLVQRIKSCVAELRLSLDNLAVVSVAIPGRVDNKKGTVIVSSKISQEVNLKEKFTKSFPNASIEINNDVVYACMGSLLSNEFDYGNGSHLYVYYGAGISCCLIYNREIVESSNGFGGEIGMNKVYDSDANLSEIVSIDKLLNNAKKTLNKQDVSLNELIQYSESNLEIKNKMLEIAKVFGGVLRNIINIAGCSHIVFSGAVTQFHKFFFDELNNVLTSANYSDKIQYRIDLSETEVADKGQIYLSRLNALDWVMAQY